MATPSDLTNLAQTGITSGTVWGSKYPTLVVSFVNQPDYLSFHETMRNDILIQKQNDAIRREVTDKLKTVNKTLNRYLKNLKDYLSDEYGKESVKVLYVAYGIEKKNGTYGFPTDNDGRARALDILIQELSKPNNPIATKKYGLNFWISQREEHKAIWASSKAIDGTRSIYADKLKTAKLEAKRLQSRLRMHLRANYGEQYKSIWRDFGFQNEKYK